jgi:hypothetical protein
MLQNARRPDASTPGRHLPQPNSCEEISIMTNPIIANSNGHLNRRAVVAAGALGAAALLGAGTALAKVGEDAELLELFEDWKVALADCSGPDLDRAHNHLRAIEQLIASTPAEGLVGIGVQLGVWEFVNNHDDVAADQALAAYDAVVRLTGRDFAAEAEMI